MLCSVFSAGSVRAHVGALVRALALVPCSVFCCVTPADPWSVPGNDQPCAHKHTQKSDGRGTVCMAQADTYMQGLTVFVCRCLVRPFLL